MKVVVFRALLGLAEFMGLLMFMGMLVIPCTGFFAGDRSLLFPTAVATAFSAIMAMWCENKAEHIARTGGWRLYQEYCNYGRE